jgi:hypothetical protein
MKTEPNTSTTPTPSKVLARICADGHKKIVYYGEDTCPLCTACGAIAVLYDQLSITQYDLQTAREAKNA